MWKEYSKLGTTEAREYELGEDLSNISISDRKTPEKGGMIARDKKDYNDQWYIAEKYFNDNFEEVKK